MKATPPDGILIIDKPAGMTSHDVVSRLRRILNTRKIGHTGTLDPFATGVLVMMVGKATRIARFLDQDVKSYTALVRFGFETDTGDRDGEDNGKWTTDNEQCSAREIVEKVVKVLPGFTGDIEQVPPMYSAKKVNGRKLYELAREGIEVERDPVSLHIYDISVTDASPLFEAGEDTFVLNVTASAGTYIRTLAEDIGRKIGVGCHLSELRRTKAGNFEIDTAVTLEELELLAEESSVESKIVNMSDAIKHLPLQMLDETELNRIAHGMQIEATVDSGSAQEVRLANSSHELIAVGQITETGTIQPRIVFKND